ncbi:MAG TPA: c-type cytochrome, partial [Gemmataceae bacterium]
KGLERVATGFWNPFGICADAHGRVFCVENDPDSCPPCRLVQVVGGGDYGFQFRYGRAGIHPLQAWDGELPGTLPMVAGTGEAPCEVRVYRGELWVTSWGDNRIEAYALQPRGAAPEGRGGRASRRVVVQGDENFRPVGLAVGPDGALYFSDWVDRSYPLHGKGRVWRLRPKGEPPARPYPALTESEKRARALEIKPDLEALKDADPFVRQAAVWGLIRNGDPASIDWRSLSDPRQRLGVLQALRWKEEAADTILPKALRDPDPDVRLAAVRWVADRGMRQYRDLVAGQLKRADGTLALFKAAATALPWLDRQALTVGDRRRGGEELLLSLLGDGGQQPALRAWALRSLPPDHPALGTDRLRDFLRGDEPALRREAVWTLALSQRPERFELLAAVARDESLPAELRADAVMGLAGAAERYEELLRRLSRSGSASLRKEARRSLRFGEGRKEAAAAEPTPSPEDIDAWMKLVEGSGDPDAGRRVFFSAAGARCASCHAVDGRGADVGPDLTRTGRQLSRRRLLESILQPSREVAPMYRAWLLEMADGRTLTGSALGPTDKGRKERFVDAEGKVFVVPTAEIESRRQTDVSIMPQGLEKTLTPEDLRDLLAFLKGGGAELRP